MKKKSSFEWKAPAALFVSLVAVFFIALNIVKKDNDFKVTHFGEVKSEVGVDGRAAVGSPEIYQVRISPALTYKLSKNYTAVWRNAGGVVLLLLGVFIALLALSVIELEKSGANVIIYGLMVIAAGCIFGAYSSAFANNYVDLSKEAYEAVKDSPEKLEALFSKPLIR